MKKLIILSFLIFSFYSGFSQRPLYRYYNGKQRKHYYTVDFNEYGNGRGGFSYEGVSCQVFDANNRPEGTSTVFRFYNPRSGDHYYNIRRQLPVGQLQGYNFEGPAFAVLRSRAPGAVPLFEYYNDRTGDHFYTADKHELGYGFEGYHFDDVVGFVFRR